MATKLKANPIKRAISSLATPATVPGNSKYEAGQYTAYGIFKGPEGMWILRVMEMDGDRVVRYHDNEPDIRAIQVGKIAMAVEGTESA